MTTYIHDLLWEEVEQLSEVILEYKQQFDNNLRENERLLADIDRLQKQQRELKTFLEDHH